MNAFEADVQKEYAHGPEPLDRANVFSAGQSAYKRIGLVAMNIEAFPEELKAKLAARLHVIQKESASMLADILQSFEEQEEITPEEIGDW